MDSKNCHLKLSVTEAEFPEENIELYESDNNRNHLLLTTENKQNCLQCLHIFNCDLNSKVVNARSFCSQLFLD